MGKQLVRGPLVELGFVDFAQRLHGIGKLGLCLLVIRLGFEKLAQQFLCVIELCELKIQSRQLLVHTPRDRVVLDGGSVAVEGLVQVVAALEQVTQGAVNFRVVGIEPGGGAEMFDGRIGISVRMVEISQLGVELGVIRLHLDRAIEQAGGLAVLSLVPQEQGEGVKDFGVAGLIGQQVTVNRLGDVPASCVTEYVLDGNGAGVRGSRDGASRFFACQCLGQVCCHLPIT